MKITHNKVGQNLNLRDIVKSDTVTKTNSALDSNSSSKVGPEVGALAKEINFSPEAQRLQKAKEAVISAPDINREKVEKLKQMVQAGTYKVDAEAVAERMLQEHLDWPE